MVLPGGRFRSAWDGSMVMLLSFIGLFTPYQIAFMQDLSYWDLSEWLPLFVLERMIDVYFVVDIGPCECAWVCACVRVAVCVLGCGRDPLTPPPACLFGTRPRDARRVVGNTRVSPPSIAPIGNPSASAVNFRSAYTDEARA